MPAIKLGESACYLSTLPPELCPSHCESSLLPNQETKAVITEITEHTYYIKVDQAKPAFHLTFTHMAQAVGNSQ